MVKVAPVLGATLDERLYGAPTDIYGDDREDHVDRGCRPKNSNTILLCDINGHHPRWDGAAALQMRWGREQQTGWNRSEGSRSTVANRPLPVTGRARSLPATSRRAVPPCPAERRGVSDQI